MIADAIPDLGKRPLIMGIINVTPDSFSQDGLMQQQDTVATALAQATQMVADGADMLDIGGESSRPGATPVSAEEEIRRTAPIIAALCKKFPTLPLSIDTTKTTVARAALENGATIINDISGGTHDPKMLPLAAATNSWLVLMHNRSKANAVTADKNLGKAYEAPAYTDIIADVKNDLQKLAEAAITAGVAKEHIILDPGLGFGKTVEQNLRLVNELDKFMSLGFPLLVGPSRKNFIGQILNAPVEDRVEGTAAMVAASILRGAAILRVHDVKVMARIARMTKSLLTASPPANAR